MNRVLLAALTLSLATGCATAVDDPVPPAPAPKDYGDPPTETFSGGLRDPYAHLTTSPSQAFQPPEVAPKQKPPIPTLAEEAPAESE